MGKGRSTFVRGETFSSCNRIYTTAVSLLFWKSSCKHRMMFTTSVLLAVLSSTLTECLSLPNFFLGVANPAIQADYSLIERTIFSSQSHHYLVGRELDENGALICGDNLVCADGRYIISTVICFTRVTFLTFMQLLRS